MRTKTLVLVLGLVVLAVAVPATYVLAHRGFSSTYYGVTGNTEELNDEWWLEMRTYMEQHWGDHEDEGWWEEMREYMEQRWGDSESEDWWNEMKEYMDEHWTELEDDNYRYGNYGGYGGYSRCGGMR